MPWRKKQQAWRGVANSAVTACTPACRISLSQLYHYLASLSAPAHAHLPRHHPTSLAFFLLLPASLSIEHLL